MCEKRAGALNVGSGTLLDDVRTIVDWSGVAWPPAEGSAIFEVRALENKGATLKSGDTLGPYQLIAPIGVGGMGRVWVARETGNVALPRMVAIKTALSEETASEDFWKALFDEARIASLLSHPNLCTIHAVEQERGIHYLVMDFSDGGSLREMLDEMPGRRIEPYVAARIVARMCAGLHAAHELLGDDGQPLGVVHRDVSPQNVLIATNGQVRLTDFGVARARGQLHAPTQTGEVKGKIAYMAPEQVTTRDIDRRADIFAAGCVLYEATVGERPFQGGDALSTLYQLLEEPIVPPSARLTGYPPELEKIVLKAMERDRDARYQTSEELSRALDGWLMTEKAMVSDGSIAAVLKTALGERLSKRQQKIEAAIHAIDTGARAPQDSLVEVVSTSESGSVMPQGPKTLAGAALPEASQAKRSPKVLIGVAAAAALLGLAFLLTRNPATPAGGPSAGATATGLTNPEPPKPTAMVPTPSAPAELTPAATTAPTPSVGVSATTSARLNTPRVRPAALPKPPVTSATTTAPTSPPPKSGELPPVIRKPPRTLDAENPFDPKPE
jgi:serine/threonine protein kinase